MTTAVKEQMDFFQASCRRQNLRLTPQRLEIFKELAQAADHPSAEQLYLRLQDKMPTLSLDTIYRTLSTFVQYGLVNRVETVESQARFEVAHARHHHLICSRCKKIMDFDWSPVDQLELPPEVQQWGEVYSKNVVVYGVCKDCLS
ncbi:MAG: Fur family transcriptional regulator [Pelovirga sp.]